MPNCTRLAATRIPATPSLTTRPSGLEISPKKLGGIVTFSRALTLIIWGIKFLSTKPVLDSPGKWARAGLGQICMISKELKSFLHHSSFPDLLHLFAHNGRVHLCGGEKISILFLISSICLLDSSFHVRNSDRSFSHVARSSSFRKNKEDMVMVRIGDCCRKSCSDST
jgi:hypothetical protein